MVRHVLALSLSIVFLVPLGAAAAPSPSEEALTKATVNIYCTYKSGRKTFSSTGTGFFVDSRGVIMTNAHVAAPFLLTSGTKKPVSDCTIRTGSPAKATYTARVLYISPDWIEDNLDQLKKGTPKGTGLGDVALLRVTGAVKGSLPTSFPTASLATTGNAEEGDTLLAAGYPADGKKFKDVQRKLTLVTATPELESIRYFVPPHADVIYVSATKLSAGGVSGGPVAFSNGSVLGIMTAVQGSKKEEDRSLRAITLNYVDRFVLAETGMPLLTLIKSDLGALEARTASSLSTDLVRSLTKAFLNR